MPACYRKRFRTIASVIRFSPAVTTLMRDLPKTGAGSYSTVNMILCNLLVRETLSLAETSNV